jgi:hypothetical protein
MKKLIAIAIVLFVGAAFALDDVMAKHLYVGDTIKYEAGIAKDFPKTIASVKWTQTIDPVFAIRSISTASGVYAMQSGNTIDFVGENLSGKNGALGTIALEAVATGAGTMSTPEVTVIGTDNRKYGVDIRFDNIRYEIEEAPKVIWYFRLTD